MLGLLFWAGASLLIDAWLRRGRRPDLTERLWRFQPSVADEAEGWLRRHHDIILPLGQPGEWLMIRQVAARLGASGRPFRGVAKRTNPSCTGAAVLAWSVRALSRLLRVPGQLVSV